MIPAPLATFLMWVLVVGGITVGWTQGWSPLPMAIGILLGVATLTGLSD